MMKELIIADIRSCSVNGKLEGHCLAVAENYYANFSELFDFKIAGGPVYNQYFEKNIIKLKYNTLEKRSIINQVKSVLNGISLLRKKKDSIIIFQQSGVTTVLLSLFFTKKKNDVYMIQYDTEYIDSRLKRMLYKLVKTKISGIICSGDIIGEKYDKRYCVVPDFIYTGVDRIEVQKKDIDFGVYGYITTGKGVLEVVTNLIKTKHKVMIAGKIGSKQEDKIQEKQLMQVLSPNVEYDFEFLTSEKYWMLMARTKYCVLNYQDVYANRGSGVILDCIYNKIPVVVKNRTFVDFIKEHNMGFVYEDISEVDFDSLVSEEVYNGYVKNIERFLAGQRKYIQRLYEFLLFDKVDEEDCYKKPSKN